METYGSFRMLTGTLNMLHMTKFSVLDVVVTWTSVKLPAAEPQQQSI